MEEEMEDHVPPLLDVPGEESPPVPSTDHKTKLQVQFPIEEGEVFWRDYDGQNVIGTGKVNVYKARHKATKNRVAAKEMNKIEEARKEAQWMVKLNHKNILTYGNVSEPECKLPGEKISVEVEDTDESSIDKSDNYYIIMELCQCSLLDKLIELSNKKEMTGGIRQNLFDQIYAGLAYMHQKGCTHNDIHINNIFVKYVAGNLKAVVVKYGDLADVSRDKYEDRVAGDLFNFGKILLQLFHPNPEVFGQDYDQLNKLAKTAKEHNVPPEGYSQCIWNLIRALMWIHYHDDPEQMDQFYPSLDITPHFKKEPQNDASKMENSSALTNTSEMGVASDHNATGSSFYTPQVIAYEVRHDKPMYEQAPQYEDPRICRLVEIYKREKAQAALEDTDNARISGTLVQEPQNRAREMENCSVLSALTLNEPQQTDTSEMGAASDQNATGCSSHTPQAIAKEKGSDKDPIEGNSVSTIDKQNVPRESDTPASQININNSESDGIAVDC